MPVDSVRLGVDVGVLQPNPSEIQGVGGKILSYVVPALIGFEERDKIHWYRIELVVADPNSNMKLPSLLGRDLLNNWLMRYSPRTKSLSFKVESADYTQFQSDA